MSNHSALSTPTSRRTVVKGVAWAVPAVTLATRVPAFAASGDQCYPIQWTTKGDAPYDASGNWIPGQQTISSQTSSGIPGTVTVGYGVVGQYNYVESGDTLAPESMTSSNGSVTMSTYISVPSNG